jgi:RNase adaptor protein for sRNA GlmZ degradation
MTRAKDLHQHISGNVLCELILLESERHELLAAYEHRRRQSPYPVMALQIFAHNVREHAAVAVYLAHAPDLLSFAHESSLEWLEQKIVDAWRARRDGVVARSETGHNPAAVARSQTGHNLPTDHSNEAKEATPGC